MKCPPERKTTRIDCLALTHQGLETLAWNEIETLATTAKLTHTQPGIIVFSVKDEQTLAHITYHARTLTKTFHLLSQQTFTGTPLPQDLPDIKKYLDKTFLFTCEREGTHTFTSFDIEQAFNSAIAAQYSVTLDRKNPQTRLFALITQRTITLGSDFKGPTTEDTLFFGIDYSGIDLGRRPYRIFLGTESIKGTIAAALLQFSDYNPKQILLDPFCRHGTIPIEAALLSTNISANKYDKEKIAFTKLPYTKLTATDDEREHKGTIICMDNNFKNVSNSQKNAKIAGIVKSIEFSRTDLQWLDAKIGKKNCDRIITYPPQPGRSLAESTAEKIYHDIFYQAEFILKKSGKVGLLMKRGGHLALPSAEKYGFKLEKQLLTRQGEEEISFLLFSQKKE